MLVDGAAVREHDAVDQPGEATDQFTQFFGIECLRERGEAAQVGEEHGDLSALFHWRADSGRDRSIEGRLGHGRRIGSRSRHLRNRRQQPLAMPERANAEFLQIRVSEPGQHRRVDVVVGKGLCVLLEPKSAQPQFDIHRHRRNLFPVAGSKIERHLPCLV